MSASSLPILRPATNLDELAGTLSPAPLQPGNEIDAFYCGALNSVRGEDLVLRLRRFFSAPASAGPRKAFLLGHPGCGKSTEISRLTASLDGSYHSIRLSASTELNATTFHPHDLILLILFRMLDELKRLFPDLDAPISDDILKRILRFFGDESRAVHSTQSSELDAAVSVGLGVPKLLSALLEFRAKAGGKLRVGYRHENRLVEYRFQTLSELVDLTSEFLRLCDEMLYRAQNQRWLIILEDLDKSAISSAQLRQAFVEYGGIFGQLEASLLFTIPVWLGYSQDAPRLPFGQENIFRLNDTPVFDQSHAPFARGRDALRAALLRRADSQLFVGDALELLLVASGGNLRDLFSMTLEASDRAAIREASAIARVDAEAAVRKSILHYRNLLGSSANTPDSVAWPDLQKALLYVYEHPEDVVPDEALYALLRLRAVLHFNGTGWFGIHPQVVEILKGQLAAQAGDLAPRTLLGGVFS